jgi:sugar phosphate permease
MLEVLVINALCEFLPTKWRSFFLNSAYIGYNLGQLLISLSMMLMMPNMEVSGISHCYIFFAAISFLVFVVCIFLFHDSPRNLIICGEDEKAFEILYKIKERSYFTSEIKYKIKHNILKNVYYENSGIFGFFKIFQKSHLMTTLIISGLMFSGNWVTDGSRLITNYLLEKSDLNISKSSIVTSNLILNIVTPFSCILFGFISELNLFGRKLSIFLGFLLMTLSLVPALIWPSGMLWYLTILSFFTNVSNLVTTYSSEVFSTEMRDLAFGWFNFFSYISSALSQYIMMLPMKTNWKISIILLIAACLMANILICLSPLEPLDKPLDSDFRQCQFKEESNKSEEDKQKLI